MASATVADLPNIKAIDKTSIHRISSGQVIVDLQTAVKELVENSLDAGATSIEVRFKHGGLTSVEVIDNGCGIAENDWESVGLKHYTSKLSTFDDLSVIHSFGFRGEAISSLCALCDNVMVTTTTDGPMGIQLELEQSGKVGKKTKVARQRGTTVSFTRLFASLPVRRKELQRNIKREFGKALALMNAYALGPCAGMDSSSAGVRLTVINQTENGQKVPQMKTEGVPSFKASVTALWGPKAMNNTVELDLDFLVERQKSVARRINDKYSQHCHSQSEDDGVSVQVKGLISKFTVGCGRTGTDRQFFYVNGRPCNLVKIQKAFNEVYRSFNANQSPFILANFIIPTEYCDINVSPDKRTIFMQSEQNLIDALKDALETAFASHSSTLEVNGTQPLQSALSQIPFNSPFSKRLSIKTAKSGGSSSEPQTELQKGAPKEKRSLPVDGDQGQDEDSQPEITAPQLPSVDKPEGTTRPVMKRIDQLLKASDCSRSKARSADEASRMEEPSSGQKSADTSKEAQQGKAVSAGVESMDVDQPQEGEGVQGDEASRQKEHSLGLKSTDTSKEAQQGKAVSAGVDTMDVDQSPEGGRGRERDVPQPVDAVVMDTTKAIWNKVTRKENDSVPEKRADKEFESVEEVEGPAPKKRRVDEGNQVSTTKIGDRSVTKASDAKNGGLTSAENLRKRLARYASGGSQAIHEDDGRLTSAGNRMDEDDETMDQTKKNEMKGTTDGNSVTAIAPSTMVAAKTKSGGTFQKPIEVDGEGDVLIEDVEPSTSSTVAVSETQPLEVIKLVTKRGPPASGASSCQGLRPEIIRKPETTISNVKVRFDLEQVKDKWNSKRKRPLAIIDNVSSTSAKISADASLANTEDNESAMRALERVIDKSDFENMDILGQFNLGFIIVRRTKNICDEEGKEDGIMDDLFIVDQHAADEKYNFETLQQTTKIQSQTLFKPRPLELTAADELIAIENIDVLKDNGFELEVDETAVAGQGARLQVTAFPVSKSTEFGMKDLEELINLMRDQPTGRMVRCSKARDMFAMRACRKSVMIGMALNQSQMASVVQHMGTMDQPWNCPHGRPTMRHLIDLCQTSLRNAARTINWSALMNDLG